MGEFINGIAVKGEKRFQMMSMEDADSSAKNISLERKIPVLSAYIYDGDFWGYTLYVGGELKDEFATMPEYFETGEKVIEKYSADSNLLAKTFDIPHKRIKRYLYHWPEDMSDREEFAYEEDRFSYGDAWQMVDFLNAMGFLYPEEDIATGDICTENADNIDYPDAIKVDPAVLHNIDFIGGGKNSCPERYFHLEDVHADTVVLEDLINAKSVEIPDDIDRTILELRTKAVYSTDPYERIECLQTLFFKDSLFSAVYQKHMAWEYHRLGKDDKAREIVSSLIKANVKYRPDHNDFMELYEELGFGQLRPEWRFRCIKKCDRGAFAVAQDYIFKYYYEGCYVTDSAGNVHLFKNGEELEYFEEKQVWKNNEE